MTRLLLAATALLAAGSATAADPQQQARTLLDEHARTILRVAHPTTKFNRAEYKGVDPLRDGFLMYYDLHYTSAFKKKHILAMAFDFDTAGAIRGLKVKSDTGKVGAFTASDLGVDVMLG
jgi:hypothetical protein